MLSKNAGGGTIKSLFTRVGMNSSEFHESIGMVLTDATPGHSKDID